MEDKIKGVTESGFEFELDRDALDDYELLEALHELDKGDYGYITEVTDRLLGEEQKEKLKNHLRTDTGKVSASKMMKEIGDIFKASKEVKN